MTQGSWNERIRDARNKRKWTQDDLAGYVETDVITVSRWERRKNIPDEKHQRKLEELFPNIDFAFPKKSGGKQEQIWNVPYIRNPFFTGREEVLQELYTNLNKGNLTALTQAIRGLGGIGKTQTASEYAHRYRHNYEAVLWLRATQEHYTTDLINIANLLHLPEAKKQKQDEQLIVRAIIRWLREHTRWLLILDNVQERVDVGDLLSRAGTGHILLTTRVKSIADLAYNIELDDMIPEEGALLLLRRAHIVAPGATLDMAAPADRAAALELSRVMDGLPLALELAGAYIRATGYTLTRYQEEYRKRRAELLQWRIQEPRPYSDYAESVATTWSLSFERVSDQYPAAIDLLHFCSFLNPDAIPEDLILRGAPVPGSLQKPLPENTEALNQMLIPLLNYSLIRRSALDKMLSIHRLVQAVIRDGMSEDDQRQWAGRTIQAVASVFSPAASDLLHDYEQYVPHVSVSAELIEQYKFTDEVYGHLLYVAGDYWRRHAWYSQAEQYCKQALQLYRHVLGSEHTEVARNLNNLALLYEEMRMHKQAEPLFQRALEIFKRVYPSGHPDKARTLSNLARCYYFQGKLPQAEPLFNQALFMLEKTAGPQDLDFATSLAWLATIYREWGKYRQAESLYKRVLIIRTNKLPAEHPAIAESLNALAVNYHLEGRYDRAVDVRQRALVIFKKTLGQDHPDVALCLAGLADTFTGQGKFEQAEQCNRQALAIYEAVVGLDHLDAAEPICGLAILAQLKGQYSDAETLYQSAQSIIEKSQGREHPGLFGVLVNYAKLLRILGRIEEAVLLEERAGAIQARIEGTSTTE